MLSMNIFKQAVCLFSYQALLKTVSTYMQMMPFSAAHTLNYFSQFQALMCGKREREKERKKEREKPNLGHLYAGCSVLKKGKCQWVGTVTMFTLPSLKYWVLGCLTSLFNLQIGPCTLHPCKRKHSDGCKLKIIKMHIDQALRLVCVCVSKSFLVPSSSDGLLENRLSKKEEL